MPEIVKSPINDADHRWGLNRGNETLPPAQFRTGDGIDDFIPEPAEYKNHYRRAVSQNLDAGLGRLWYSGGDSDPIVNTAAITAFTHGSLEQKYAVPAAEVPIRAGMIVRAKATFIIIDNTNGRDLSFTVRSSNGGGAPWLFNETIPGVEITGAPAFNRPIHLEGEGLVLQEKPIGGPFTSIEFWRFAKWIVVPGGSPRVTDHVFTDVFGRTALSLVYGDDWGDLEFTAQWSVADPLSSVKMQSAMIEIVG